MREVQDMYKEQVEVCTGEKRNKSQEQDRIPVCDWEADQHKRGIEVSVSRVILVYKLVESCCDERSTGNKSNRGTAQSQRDEVVCTCAKEGEWISWTEDDKDVAARQEEKISPEEDHGCREGEHAEGWCDEVRCLDRRRC